MACILLISLQSAVSVGVKVEETGELVLLDSVRRELSPLSNWPMVDDADRENDVARPQRGVRETLKAPWM